MNGRLRSELPVDEALPPLRDALDSTGIAVLLAPPGAGKTTRVPLALLDERWLGTGRIVMLEPRRLAARGAAAFMARLLGERVGDTVGHRVRMDSRVGPRTRVEVVTEGVLTRMLQRDPLLEGVGLVIFDEFHERSIHADLGLALVLQARELVREDLRVLVMSATLEGDPVSQLLGAAPVVRSSGRAHPVEIRWRPVIRGARVESATAATVREALARDEGDALVFLPGAAEIRRTLELLRASITDPRVRLMSLYGDLPQAEQDAAVAPSEDGWRKVVLATAIAETSLTIEGVRIVVDSGLSRVPRFDPGSGMTRLATVRVSGASAEQRRGRAGRNAPGVCWRLWDQHEHQHLLAHRAPEIMEADLSPLALELAAAGVREPGDLRWLDPPPERAFAAARDLLARLGAVDVEGRVSAHGIAMVELGAHPRLAHMLLSAREMDVGSLACDIAALLGARDPLRSGGDPPDADIRLRLEALRGDSSRVPPDRRRALAGIRAEADMWRTRLGVSRRGHDIEMAGVLLALAYPDRVAQRRPGTEARYVMRAGGGAAFGSGQSLHDSPFIVAAELGGERPESRIFLAAPITQEDVERIFGEQIITEDSVHWEVRTRMVLAVRRTRLGDLVLAESRQRQPDPHAVTAVLLEEVRRSGVSALPWMDAATQTRTRLAFMHELHRDELDRRWPDVSDEALTSSLESWLAPRLTGISRWSDLERVDVNGALLDMVPWPLRARLDELAPTHVAVPSGSRIPVDYSRPSAPALAVRLQEMFGCVDTPTVAGGRVPLTLHLLSPARRPVQVTRDLRGFWATSYFEVRKELRGRYPKHHWPINPLTATATNRTKARG